jgi:hypothetical protein
LKSKLKNYSHNLDIIRFVYYKIINLKNISTKSGIHSNYLYHILILILLAYLIFGVGIHGDDHTEIIGMKGIGLWEFLIPNPYKHNIQTLGLPNFYVYWWAFPVLGYEYQWIYDVIKIVVHGISIYLIFIFAKDYLKSDRALLMSMLFVLYPLHDTTAYWYMTLYYITVPAIILYAHSLIRKDKFLKGFLLSLLGAMFHYASPPYVFGMAMIFVFEKKIKKALLFSLPGFFYIFYYFWFKFSFPEVERRINPDLEIISFIKNFTLQTLSFIEAAIGPSYWLKVFYSLNSISFMSLSIVLIISISIFKAPKLSKSMVIKKPALYGILVVVILSFAMFSLTGLYTHSAFNTSNRATIYGSLLIAFLLASLLPANKKTLIILILFFIAPIFGLSDHWKSWNAHQKIIIKNIQENPSLKVTDENSSIIVTGNLYSKLGPFSHIEFFSMPWNVDALFKHHTNSKEILALTPYTSFQNNQLFDKKFNHTYSLKNKVYVYDSVNNYVKEINKSNIDELIKKQPKILRHWTQLVKDTWIQKFIVQLSPRLNYLFN